MEVYNYTVYAHINKTNGKMYVGITQRDPIKRWQYGAGYSYNGHFYNAIKKYGWDGFDHEIVASGLSKAEATNFEKILVDLLDLTNPDKGYNLCEGGGLPPIQKGADNYFYGKHFCDENHPNYNKPISDETRKRMSEAQKRRGMSGKNNPFFGNHMFANGNSPNCKKVMCVETGKIYDAIAYAAEENNLDRASIRYALKDSKHTSGGYHWVLYTNET